MAQLSPYEMDYLFKLLADGDENAFASIIEIYFDDLFTIIKSIVIRDELVKEIINDLFQALWENKKTVVTLENPGGWLYTAARYASFNVLKKEKRKKTFPLEEEIELPDGNSPDDDLELKELQTYIRLAVEKLPERKRLIYRLSRDQGLTRKEIAEQMGISESTVKNQLTQTLKQIREFMAKMFKSFIV